MNLIFVHLANVKFFSHNYRYYIYRYISVCFCIQFMIYSTFDPILSFVGRERVTNIFKSKNVLQPLRSTMSLINIKSSITTTSGSQLVNCSTGGRDI
jgi:hypothetical protein